MTCPICGQLPGDPMTRPFGCFGRGERECTLRASEALGKHGRPLAWAADELRRELADAKAEVERLNRVLEDEAIEASAALRSEMATLLSAGSCESPEDAAQRVMRELADARSELSELRAALAAAAMASSPERGEALEGYSLRCAQRYPDGSYRAVFDHPSEEPVGLPLFGGASLGRSSFDAMAERAGPLPTAVLADSPDESPIESLGPVPVGDNDMRRWEDAERAPTLSMAVAWLIRDAVRRGAKLEDK